MKKIKFIAVTGLILFFSLSVVSQNKPENKSTEIIILHTNDMHAKIDNLPKLAYLVDSLRKIHPYVFLMAAGDNFTGNPIVDVAEDKGYPMIDLMNRCGFDVSVIGNHEFDLGQEFLNKRMAQANFPFICANIEVTKGILKQPQPYVVLNAGESRIAVLGLIELNDKELPDSHPSNMDGIKFTDGIEKAKEFVPLKEKCNILVALSHLGVETDVKLAKAIPQFDLIIGGHSHTVIDTAMLVNGVMIVQAGANLKYIGKTTVNIRNGKLVSRKDELIPVSSLKKNSPTLQILVDQYNDNKEFKKVVAIAERPIEGFDELGSLYTDAMRDQFKVNYAFQNRYGVRVNSFPQGDITLKDIYQMDPFQNQVIIFRLNGAEIESLIRNAYNQGKQIDLATSGMKYTIITTRTGRCLNIDMIDKSGHPILQDQDYIVAISSYLAASYTFDHKDPGYSTGVTTEQALSEFLRKMQKINYSGVKRTFIKANVKKE